MSESAVERALSDAAFSLRERIRRHDRFVVIAFIFSLFPLPPACFVGLLLSVVNAWLLVAGRLDKKEARLVKVCLLLGVVNSLVVVMLIAWFHHHFPGFSLPGEIIKWLRDVLQTWPWLWGRNEASRGVLI